MNWAFETLGLDADADHDERAIKRAYAAKLKTTRPDEDPEGFQRLHEAYQHALAFVRDREAHEPDQFEEDREENRGDAPEDRSTPGDQRDSALPSPIEQVAEWLPELQTQMDTLETRIADAEALLAQRASAPVEPDTVDDAQTFDLDAFLQRCTALAEYSRDGELRAWLHAQPILWSLQHKSRIAHWLLQHLHAQRPPVPAERFDVLAEFFALNDLHSGYDAYSIHMLRHRLQLTWEVKTHQSRQLAERTGREGSSLAAAIRQTDRILKQLTRPLHWPQALIAGLLPAFPGAVRQFLYRLDHGRLDDLPAPIDPDQVAFWDAAADRLRLSKPRLALVALRCVAYALIGTLLVVLFNHLIDNKVSLQSMLDTFAPLLAGLSIGWISMTAGQALVRWQCLPDDEVERAGWLHRALVPLAAAASTGIAIFTQLDAMAAVLGAMTLIVAWRRYRARGGAWVDSRANVGVWVLAPIFLWVILVSYISEHEPRAFIFMLPVLSLLFWMTDMLKLFRQR